MIDWQWIESLEEVEQTEYIRHVRTLEEMEIRVDGQSGSGAIFRCCRDMGDVFASDDEDDRFVV